MEYTQQQIIQYKNEINELCHNYPDNYSRMLMSKTRKYLYDFIMWFTPCLNDSFYKLSTKCYWVLNDIKSWDNELVQCLHCHKPLKHKNARAINGYKRPHCNVSCSQADKNVYSKINETKSKKYNDSCNSEQGSLTRIYRHFLQLKENMHMELCCSSFEEYLKIKRTTGIFKFKCKKCNSIIYSKLTNFTRDGINYLCRCYHCFPTIHTRSKAEIEIFDICKSFCDIKDYKIIANYRKLIHYCNKALELDIVIPDIKFAIEYDGDYYHSEEYFEHRKEQNKDHNRKCISMLNKTMLVEEQGYQLYHISESAWKQNKQEIINYLMNKIISNEKFKLNAYREAVDRQIHNINDIPEGYALIGSVAPSIDIRSNFHVKNCGHLIYEKINK